MEHPSEAVIVVVLDGEHDLGTAPDVRAAFAQAVDGTRSVLVDLGSATFVDSSILGALLDARRHARENDRGFAVARGDASEAVRRVLEVTGLDEELPVYPTRDEAVGVLERR